MFHCQTMQSNQLNIQLINYGLPSTSKTSPFKFTKKEVSTNNLQTKMENLLPVQNLLPPQHIKYVKHLATMHTQI